jgi:hypothetical protein
VLAVAALISIVGCSQAPEPTVYRLIRGAEQVSPAAENDEPAATVLIFTRTDCPISNRTAPEVKRIGSRFAPQEVVFWLVYVDPAETVEPIEKHVESFGYSAGVLRDPEHVLVELSGARVTPEAAVFLPDGSMIYRGRIDDQFEDFGKARPAPATHDLEDVLDAILRGEALAPRTTTAIGCFIQGQ